MYSCDGKAEFSEFKKCLTVTNVENIVLLNIFVETIFFSSEFFDESSKEEHLLVTLYF